MSSLLINNDILETLSKAGIEFTVHLFDSNYILSPTEVLRYLEEPELFAAEKHGISLRVWKSWIEHYNNPTCHALTKKGNPCRNSIIRVDLKNYVPGVSEYCAIHQNAK
jgi:hypothetical protein